MPTESKEKANRLIKEKSPYLQQHAYNPVDWFPWNKEAFQQAKRKELPVFLSIGYSTCHWCHVMEEESFSDQEVADLLNSSFIPIKVDREERPDIDHIYMTFCQLMTGRGGWPLTVFMTPEKRPFFAGTYFPKNAVRGMSGLIDILKLISNKWEEDREELIRSSHQISAELKKTMEGVGERKERRVDPDLNMAARAYLELEKLFEPEYGGFSNAPKFPTPHQLFFLFRYWKQSGEDKALKMAARTLQGMQAGGIYDHLGGGFCRYSTDKKWLIPHFEKMLYDNALLTMAYLEAYQITGQEYYAAVAREILSYLLRDMAGTEGGFYSAEDADVEGIEGQFYLWDREQVLSLLGEKRGQAFCNTYNLTAEGNFEDLNLPHLISYSAEEITEILKEFAEERRILFKARRERTPPFKDDKVLTGWNGLIIAALATAARVLSDKEYLRAAERATDFIEQKLIRSDGRLMARYREREAAYPAYLNDYAFFIWGLLELYTASFNPYYLKQAIKHSQKMKEYFWDQKNGGFYFYGHDAEDLIARPKKLYDGATPSGNSAATYNLTRLATMTGEKKWEEMTEKEFEFFAPQIKKQPVAYTHFLSALMMAKNPPRQLVITGQRERETTREMLEIVNKEFLPFTASLFYSPEKKRLKKIIPVLEERELATEKTTALICQDYSCLPPITEAKKLREVLQTSAKTIKL